MNALEKVNQKEPTESFHYFISNYTPSFSATQRFCSSAVNASPQNWNAYTYVKGNPVNFNDPSGHMYRQIGHSQIDYAPWMGISRTPDPEEYMWGGAGGGGAGVVGTPGNTISNLLHGFDTSSLTSEELEKFTWGLILLSKTALGNATLNAIKAPGLPIEIRSFSKKQGCSGAPWGNTMTKVENGKIAGFTVTFNFHGTPFSQPSADNSFVQFKGLKGNYKWAEILGHEFRHIEYDLTHPEEAVERVGYELRKDLSNPSYIDLKNKAHKENIYPYEKNLLKQLFLEQSMSD